jgi:microcystin-dependent protein
MRASLLTVVSIAAFAVALPTRVNADAVTPYVGEVMSTGHNFCPVGWAPMNGQLVPILENETLFQLIGTTYGGDGQTTFALPAVRPIFSATGATLTQCISLFGIFPSQN